jgi:hypothetical protein
VRLTSEDIEPLEMLADTVAALLVDHSSVQRRHRLAARSANGGSGQREPTTLV